MKFALRYCNTGRYVEPAEAVALMQAGEEAGFESAWTVDHVVIPAGYESAYPYAASGKMAGGVEDLALPDPLIWMAYVAARTSRIKLATGILIVPQRNPVVTASQIASLDQISGGRVILGIGVGWLREEFDAIGVPFDDRGRRTDEYIAAMRELWSADKPTFHGEFVNVDGAYCRPQPVRGSVPIHVGGHSKAAARRAGRLGDGYFPARAAEADMVSLMRQTAAEHGRDPDAIEITMLVPKDLDEIPALAAAGITRLQVSVTDMAGVGTTIATPDDALGWRDTIEKYADV